MRNHTKTEPLQGRSRLFRKGLASSMTTCSGSLSIPSGGIYGP